jgi:hypothetical protein
MHDWQNTGYQQRQFCHSNDSNHSPSISIDASPSSDDVLGNCIFECGHVESPFHYMHCQSDFLVQERKRGRERLDRDLHKMRTSPALTEAILQGIAFWEDGTEFELSPDSNKLLFDEDHTKLLNSQENIGWEKFLKGYVSKEWGRLQEYHYSKIQRKHIHTRNNWVWHLLRSLHTYRHSIWTAWNQVLHGGSTKAQQEYTRRKMLKTITKLYWEFR